MDRSEISPGESVMYFYAPCRSGKSRNGLQKKELARVIRIGKHRVTIQLASDGSFRFVEAVNLQREKK